MEWFGLALFVLGALALILVLNRRQTTLVTPPASAKPDPSASGASAGNARDPNMDSILEDLTDGKGWGATLRSGKKQKEMTTEDRTALLGKMGLPSGLMEEALKSLPRAEEARLQYPGSTLVFSWLMLSKGVTAGEADRSILSSTAEADLVRGWYRDWLTSHGWLAESATPAAAETAVDSYVRNGERFRLAIMDRTLLSLPQGIVPPEGQTIYELRYVGAAK